MLTDDLTARRKVDGSLQKVTWPHGKLMDVEEGLTPQGKLTEVYVKSLGSTEC